MKCPQCGSHKTCKNGRRNERQNFICKACGRQFLEAYSRRGYPVEVKRVCMRMREQGLSYRKIERLTGVGHNTIIAWVKQAQDLPYDSLDEAHLSSLLQWQWRFLAVSY